MLQTVQDVFDIAINLIDGQNENTGDTMTSDTVEYKVKTIPLLNSLLDQVYLFSDTYAGFVGGRRPTVEKVNSFSDTINLDEYICTTVLPYGLAGLFLVDENPALSAFYWQTYLENKTLASRGIPAEWEDVDNPYADNNRYGTFSKW